ncbi:MAG TPA: HIT family protein [Bradyrhizobium sp.]|uniref:HIT family protein n=1 Tax=Bradyrhizobium sp. TaxID=376 RepID=UPI002BF3415A|nr:HIT family protein [Bradyrhizobium sp.]HLZ02439.1 HIT family protein [Bradyrhizobium sp.]
MSHECLFCRIARGEIACHAVYEGDAILAFLDIHPIRPGHTLIIPREHYPWFEDLSATVATDITTLAQRLARNLKAIYRVERVAMVYAGMHVRHVHAHVVPIHHAHDITSASYLKDGLDGFSMPPSPPAQELEETAKELRERLAPRAP